MTELFWAMLFLGIAAACNWCMGVYDNIGVKSFAWDWKKFAKGILKIAIICGCVIGLGFAWEYSGIDLSGAGVEPLTLTTGATVYYFVKAIVHLKSIVMGEKPIQNDGEEIVEYDINPIETGVVETDADAETTDEAIR